MQDGLKVLKIAGVPLMDYEIFVEGDDVCLTYAMNELQLYLHRAYGFSLAISKKKGERQIRLETGYKGIMDGFQIVCENGVLHFIGERARGTLYAVYHFLEKYVGWRFFAAKMRFHGQESGEYMHAVEKLFPPMQFEIKEGHVEEENPVVLFRDMYGHSCVDENWCTKNRFNGDIWGMRDMPKYLGGSERFASAGGHSFFELLPPDQYFDEHPDWFTFYNGKWQAGEYLQICLTNEEVVQEVAKNAIKKLRENPDALYVSVSQNDGNIFCACEKCKALEKKIGRGNVLMTFVNKVADIVGKEFPDKKIHTYAYESTLQRNLIPVRDNVVIQYCPRYCHGHTINDESCKVNKITYDYLKHFKKICKHVFLYDYRSSLGYAMQPLPDLFRFRENMRVLADCNVKGFYAETSIHCLNTPCFEELRSYVTGKLLWNPYMSEEEFNRHINEFLEGYYGAGWKSVRSYLELWHTETAGIHFDSTSATVTDDNGTPKKTRKGENAVCDFIPEEKRLAVFQKMDALLDEAASLADSAEAKRIDILKTAVLWCRLFHTMEDVMNDGTEEEKKKIIEENRELCSKIRLYCMKYTVFISMNETTKMYKDFTLPPSKWLLGFKGRTDEPSKNFIFEDIILDKYGAETV